MTHLHRLSVLAATVALIVGLAACDSGEPDPVNPEELITDVTITLTNTDDDSDTVTIAASDSDGDGQGIVFTPSSISLRPGVTYSGTITLRDAINDENITEEIEEEAEEHLFRYEFDPSEAGAVTLTDTESDYTSENENGGDYAVGLTFDVSVASTASGSGELQAILYHFDEEPKTGSDVTSDETDIDIAFPVEFAE